MNQPMKLYSGPASLFAAKVRVALAEKQLEYERVEVSPWIRRSGAYGSTGWLAGSNCSRSSLWSSAFACLACSSSVSAVTRSFV